MQYSDGVKEIVLVDQRRSGNNRNITINENDIKNVIHSKGAIYTGIEVLLKESGYKKSDLRHVFIASFTSFLGGSIIPRSPTNTKFFSILPMVYSLESGSSLGK